MKFKVILHKTKDGDYRVEVPSLPGCFSQGKTMDQALKNAGDAIRSHVERLREDGKDIPDDDPDGAA
jgi:antitoxin HicB